MNQEAQNFYYRLKSKQLTPSMEKILKALDEWSENNPSAASCQQIADLAGVHQTYIQRLICALEQAGFVKLWRHRNGMLCVPGVFVLKGYKAYAGVQE